MVDQGSEAEPSPVVSLPSVATWYTFSKRVSCNGVFVSWTVARLVLLRVRAFAVPEKSEAGRPERGGSSSRFSIGPESMFDEVGAGTPAADESAATPTRAEYRQKHIAHKGEIVALDVPITYLLRNGTRCLRVSKIYRGQGAFTPFYDCFDS